MGDSSREMELAQTREALRVVIAYNDLAAARRAMGVLRDLDRGLGDAIEFQPLPWSFELLTDPDWREAALRDAISADMLIIATSASGPLPAAVQQWVEFTFTRKQGTDAAIVALFGSREDPDDINSLRVAAVRTAAQRKGLDFFAPTPRGGIGGTGQPPPQQPPTLAPLLQEVLRGHHPPPHWGINE